MLLLILPEQERRRDVGTYSCSRGLCAVLQNAQRPETPEPIALALTLLDDESFADALKLLQAETSLKPVNIQISSSEAVRLPKTELS